MPLNELTFLNPRAKHQAAVLTDLLREKRGVVFEFPLIELRPRPERDIRRALSRLDRNSVLVFTSSNGVDAVCPILSRLEIARDVKIATIGEKTACALSTYGLSATFVSEAENSEGFASELIDWLEEGQDIFLFRANKASGLLPELLQEKEFRVVDAVVYESHRPRFSPEEVAMFQQRVAMLDMLIFTSSEVVRSFVSLMGEVDIPVAVIGPKTSRTAERLGLNVVAEPREASIEALVTAIEVYFRSKSLRAS